MSAVSNFNLGLDSGNQTSDEPILNNKDAERMSILSNKDAGRMSILATAIALVACAIILSCPWLYIPAAIILISVLISGSVEKKDANLKLTPKDLLKLSADDAKISFTRNSTLDPELSRLKAIDQALRNQNTGREHMKAIDMMAS